MSNEINYPQMQELRAHIDSIASAIFLIAGGALTLSMTVITGIAAKQPVAPDVLSKVACSWRMLLVAILLMVLLKTFLVVQEFLRSILSVDKFNAYLICSNTTCIITGLLGITTFSVGLYTLVEAAVEIIGA